MKRVVAFVAAFAAGWVVGLCLFLGVGAYYAYREFGA